MDYAALAAEVAKPDYASKTAAEVATLINAAAKTRARSVPIDEIIAHVETHELIDKLLGAQSDAGVQANTSLKLAVDKAVRMFTNPRLTVIDMTDATVSGLVGAMFGGFVQAGIWAQDESNALLALGQVSYPAWQAFGPRELDHGDIIIARGERWEDHAIPNGEAP